MSPDSLSLAPSAPAIKPPGRLSAFSWVGGKFSHLKWLLPLLPECGHYVEPYCGSCAALLNRKPSLVETLNDLNGEVVNFFKVLREQKDELIKKLMLTPWARAEYAESLKYQGESISDLEKARRFYVRIKQGFMSKEKEKGNTGYNWSKTVSSMRDAKGKITTFPEKWSNSINKLNFVSERLLKVQLENRPALYVIKKYETPETLFYVDPPYLMKTRTTGKCYVHEMTLDDYADLAEALNACQCKVALSAYEHGIIDELFPSGKWMKHKERPKPVHGGGVRTEVLYTNYDPHEKQGKNKLF